MKQMTLEECNANCHCDDSGDLCSVCERYYDDHCEEYEESKRRRIQEEQEY